MLDAQHCRRLIHPARRFPNERQSNGSGNLDGNPREEVSALNELVWPFKDRPTLELNDGINDSKRPHRLTNTGATLVKPIWVVMNELLWGPRTLTPRVIRLLTGHRLSDW